MKLGRTIYITLFTLLLAFSFTISAHAERLQTEPVIQDDMGLLSSSQIDEINQINDKLAKLKTPQQIWVYTSRSAPDYYDSGFADDTGDHGQVKISDSVSESAKVKIAEQLGIDYNNPTTMQTDKLNNTTMITVIFVSPSMKQPVSIAMSDDMDSTMGGIRQTFFNFKIDNQTMSGTNIVNTAKNYSAFMEKHLDTHTMDRGPEWDTTITWTLIILGIFFLIRHIVKGKTGGGSSGSGDSYDSGFGDGWWLGQNSGNDERY